MKKVYAIVVCYNGKQWYDRCLGSLNESTVPVETVVIDNASSDDSVEYIRNRFPWVHLFESEENLGFAQANNIGIRYAIDHDADFVFLLNQDAWVENDTISELMNTFEENDNVGIASPIHLNGSYTALDHGFVNYIGGDFASDAYMGKLRKYYERPFINAAAWIISRQCIDSVGGFDTLLFKHYGEDVNFCQRVLFFGFHIIVNTHCTICHDREDRKGNDHKFDTLAKRTSFLEERITFGNINSVFDIKSIKSSIRRKIKRKVLMGKFSSVKKLKERIVFFETIEQSRSINQQSGMNWL